MIKKYSIIDIIPLINLPPQVNDFFSYFSEKKIKPGSIVEVEFKKQIIHGYVFRVEEIEKRRQEIKKYGLNLKPVLKIINDETVILKKQISLAFWLKKYANLSLASALNMFFLYNQLKLVNKNDFKLKNSLNKKQKYEINNKNYFDKNDIKNKKSLIIVPRDNYFDYFKINFPFFYILEPKFINKNIKEVLSFVFSEQKITLIGNRNVIFLPWQNLDQIIIFEEGSIFYKEFFKPPFIDFRKVFLKFAQINKIKYISIDEIPSFYLISKNHSLEKKVENIKFEITKINEQEFENEIKNFKKTIIFVPEKNFGSKIVCQNCFYTFTCKSCFKFLSLNDKKVYCPYCLKEEKLPEACPKCNFNDTFIIYHKGAKSIFKYLQYLNRKVYLLEKDSKKIIKNFNKEKEADLVGSLLLLTPIIEKVDAFFFFNFDQFYFSNNIFQKEKFIRILNFFKNKSKNLFIVSNVFDYLIEKKIKEGGILNLILEERKINNLPPYKRLVILKEGSVNLENLQKKMTIIKEKLKKSNPSLEIYGPIFASPFKKRKRFFLELVLKIETKLDFNLKKILKDIEVEEIDTDALSY